MVGRGLQVSQLKRSDSAQLTEALALLYTHDGKHSKTLDIYLHMHHRGVGADSQADRCTQRPFNPGWCAAAAGFAIPQRCAPNHSSWGCVAGRDRVFKFIEEHSLYRHVLLRVHAVLELDSARGVKPHLNGSISHP